MSLVRFRVRAPLIQRTRPKGGFLLFRGRTLHRTAFDYSPSAAHPFGASAPGALFNACGVSPSPGTTYSENPPKRRVFAFPGPDSPSNYVRLFAASGSPLRGQRARHAAGGVAEYRGATASNKAAILPGMITARPISGKRATQQSSAIKLTIKPGSTASGDLSNNIIGSTAQLALSFIFYAIACRRIIEKTIRDSGYYE